MGSVRVNGMLHQLSLLLKSADAEDAIPLVASSVRVVEAGAFVRLAALEFEGGVAARDIINRAALGRMARASDLLVVLQSALLPHLHRFPTDKFALKVLEICTERIRLEGREAGGSFHRQTASLADRMEAYIVDARTHIPYSSHAGLCEDVDDILHRVKIVLNGTSTLKQTEAVEAEAGAAAAAAAGSQVHVNGVRHQLSILVKRASAYAEHHHLLPTLLVASSVRVREAGAFAQLAALEFEGGAARDIFNRVALESMARASDLLVVLQSALLPHLQLFPTEDVALNVLEVCAAAIRLEGREAGGSFHQETTRLADRMDTYVANARTDVPYNAALREEIDDIVNRVKLVLNGTYTLKTEAGAAEA